MGFVELEECRRLLRELMKFRSNNMPKKPIRIYVTDDEHQITTILEPFNELTVNMDEYVKRVETALQNELADAIGDL